MCQQRQYYFKDYVWKILAVYINIYYLYFVFETADMEKSGDIYCSKDIKNVDVDEKKSLLVYLFRSHCPLFHFDQQKKKNV